MPRLDPPSLWEPTGQNAEQPAADAQLEDRSAPGRVLAGVVPPAGAQRHLLLHRAPDWLLERAHEETYAEVATGWNPRLVLALVAGGSLIGLLTGYLIGQI